MNVFSYWSGPVTWMERLSVVSARATGHDLTVFTYDDHAKLASAFRMSSDRCKSRSG